MNQAHKQVPDIFFSSNCSSSQAWSSPSKGRSSPDDDLYLANREGGKLRFSYIGSVGSEKAREILDQVNDRKKYELKLKQVKDDLKEVGKVNHSGRAKESPYKIKDLNINTEGMSYMKMLQDY